MQQPFKKLKIHQPSLPPVSTTPRSERSGVVANPTRLPINRQAALAVRQKRCWIEEPPVEKPTSVPVSELVKARADLKIERNKMANLSDDLGACRASVIALRAQLERSKAEIALLHNEIREYKDIIKQLEDLKL